MQTFTLHVAGSSASTESHQIKLTNAHDLNIVSGSPIRMIEFQNYRVPLEVIQKKSESRTGPHPGKRNNLKNY